MTKRTFCVPRFPNVPYFRYLIGSNSFRSTRTNSNRKKFKVDSLLDRLEQKLKDSGNEDGVPQGGFITVTFLGYYDGKKSYKFLEGSVPVELVLLKMCHKKRKETPYIMETVGMVEVPCNPSGDNPPNKAPTISVSVDSLMMSNGQPVRLIFANIVSPNDCNFLIGCGPVWLNSQIMTLR